MANKRDPETGLLPRQARVLELLLSGHTQRSAAKESGVHARLIARWCSEDPLFRATLNTRRLAASDDTGRKVLALSAGALHIVWRLAADTTVPAPVRLAACRDLLDRAERYVERASGAHDAVERATANTQLFKGLQVTFPLEVTADTPVSEDARQVDDEGADALIDESDEEHP